MNQLSANLCVKATAVSFSQNTILIDRLRKYFPDAEVNSTGQRFSREELINYLREADAAIVGTESLSKNVLGELPKLKVISKYGVGLDNVDLSAAAQMGKKILWTSGINRRSVSELALGLMMGLSRNIFITSTKLKNGQWNKSGGSQLTEKTVGIIGFGNIGSDLATLLQPFRTRILVNDILDKSDLLSKYAYIKQVTLDEVIESSDFISIHTPLTEKTRNLINLQVLKKCKPSAVLVNTARGGIINECDLYDALTSGLVAGAASDVFEVEPPLGSPLLGLDNFIPTPHIGGNAKEAIEAMGEAAIKNLVEFIADNSI